MPERFHHIQVFEKRAAAHRAAGALAGVLLGIMAAAPLNAHAEGDAPARSPHLSDDAARMAALRTLQIAFTRSSGLTISHASEPCGDRCFSLPRTGASGVGAFRPDSETRSSASISVRADRWSWNFTGKKLRMQLEF